MKKINLILILLFIMSSCKSKNTNELKEKINKCVTNKVSSIEGEDYDLNKIENEFLLFLINNNYLKKDEKNQYLNFLEKYRNSIKKDSLLSSRVIKYSQDLDFSYRFLLYQCPKQIYYETKSSEMKNIVEKLDVFQDKGLDDYEYLIDFTKNNNYENEIIKEVIILVTISNLYIKIFPIRKDLRVRE